LNVPLLSQKLYYNEQKEGRNNTLSQSDNPLEERKLNGFLVHHGFGYQLSWVKV